MRVLKLVSALVWVELQAGSSLVAAGAVVRGRPSVICACAKPVYSHDVRMGWR